MAGYGKFDTGTMTFVEASTASGAGEEEKAAEALVEFWKLA